MRRIISILIIILFFIWILPLGIFIKPKDEKKTCNGKRAICLCSHFIAKQMAKTAGKQFLKGGGGVNKLKESSPSLGPDFVFTIIKTNFLLVKNQYMQSTSIFVNQLYIRPIEHVPKV